VRQEGTFTVRASQEKVWSFFLDPVRLASAIADPHMIEIIDDNTFKGQIKTGVGPIRGTFNGSAQIVEREPPRRARIKAHGAGMGSAFDVDSTIEMSESGGLTTVKWAADVVLNGTIATMGARLLEGTIDRKTSEFFENVRKKLEPH